jgi:DNA polymerase I
MKSKKDKIIIIDSNAVIHRAFHALPELTAEDGSMVNALYGFLLAFFRAVKDFRPDYAAAAFDFPAPTFRHKKYKEYKATREKAPDELLSQIPKTKEVLKKFKVPVFEKKGYEADDIIGAIAKKTETIETIILTGDLDMLQLVDEKTKVYNLRRGIKDAVLYDIEKVSERYQGLKPCQLIDFKALRGDPSDNIPGVAGIGEKTAIKLIKEFGSLENLYYKIRKTSGIKDSLKKKLLENRKKAFLSKSLVKIEKELPIGFQLEQCFFGGYNKEEIKEIFSRYQFKTLTGRLSELENKDNLELL